MDEVEHKPILTLMFY